MTGMGCMRQEVADLALAALKAKHGRVRTRRRRALRAQAAAQPRRGRPCSVANAPAPHTSRDWRTPNSSRGTNLADFHNSLAPAKIPPRPAQPLYTASTIHVLPAPLRAGGTPQGLRDRRPFPVFLSAGNAPAGPGSAGDGEGHAAAVGGGHWRAPRLRRPGSALETI